MPEWNSMKFLHDSFSRDRIWALVLIVSSVFFPPSAFIRSYIPTGDCLVVFSKPMMLNNKHRITWSSSISVLLKWYLTKLYILLPLKQNLLFNSFVLIWWAFVGKIALSELKITWSRSFVYCSEVFFKVWFRIIASDDEVTLFMWMEGGRIF